MSGSIITLRNISLLEHISACRVLYPARFYDSVSLVRDGPSHRKEATMADLLTIKGAKVAITAKGVAPIMGDRDAVHAAVLAPASNRTKGDADRQALAMFLIALFRTVAGTVCEPTLAGRREWVAKGGAHFVVDAGTMLPDMVGDEGWNDQAFLFSAIKWGAGIGGINPLQVGMVRITKGDHKFYIVPQGVK